MQKVEITETYNKDGVCVKRTANGVELEPDTQPSVVFLNKDFIEITRKTLMTEEEFKHYQLIK